MRRFGFFDSEEDASEVKTIKATFKGLGFKVSSAKRTRCGARGGDLVMVYTTSDDLPAKDDQRYADIINALMDARRDKSKVVKIEVRFDEWAAQKEAARMAGHSLKVGDILCGSWGYEQTNVNFYQVVAVTRSTVDVKPITARKVEDLGWNACTVAAVKGSFFTTWDGIDIYRKKRVGAGGYVKINDCICASLWDGKPVTETSYA